MKIEKTTQKYFILPFLVVLIKCLLLTALHIILLLHAGFVLQKKIKQTTKRMLLLSCPLLAALYFLCYWLQAVFVAKQ